MHQLKTYKRVLNALLRTGLDPEEVWVKIRDDGSVRCNDDDPATVDPVCWCADPELARQAAYDWTFFAWCRKRYVAAVPIEDCDTV